MLGAWVFPWLVLAAVAHAQDADTVRDALARRAREPGVREVVAAVLRHAEIDPGRADGAMERARLSGLLPILRAGIRQGQGYDWLARQTDTTGTSSVTSGQQLAFVAQMTFRLDRLLYAPDERALLRESRSAAERRLELIAEIVQLYFERRRLLVEQDLGAALDVEREARVLEIESLFEVLSAGEIVLGAQPDPTPEPPPEAE